MSVQLYQEVVALTSREYRPFTDLNQLLGAFLKAAVEYAHAGSGAIKVADFGGTRSSNSDLEVFVDKFPENQPDYQILEHPPSLEADSISKVALGQGDGYTVANPTVERMGEAMVSTPIIYHHQPIGEVISRPDDSRMESGAYLDFQNIFARELAFYIKRYQANKFAKRKLGRNMLLVGTSHRMRRVDQFVERASEADLPVLISGPFGSEKTEVACAIHFNGPRCELPLVEVNCPGLSPSNMAEELEKALKEVKGGTLFLNSVDEMPLALQNLMPKYLESRLGQWLGHPRSRRDSRPRIMASATGELHELVEDGQFSRSLLAELDFLRIRLPPLRERREDIASLVAYTFEKYRCDPSQCISPRAMACLESYHWPENLFEVERVIARLATLAHGGTIDVEALKMFAPQVLADGGESKAPAIEAPVLEAAILEDSTEESLGEAHMLAKQLLEGEFSALNQCHLGLQRALRYLAKHYPDDLTLTELADEAYLSVSHLSYLFKSELGESYKSVLTMIRIEKACQLLTGDIGMRITDVALESGFGDLSHFTKTFKKMLGCNPKDYRLSHGELDGSGAVA